jgi:FAD binding domain
MDRRTFLKASGLSVMAARWPLSLFEGRPFRRLRPSDPDWPAAAAWKRLHSEVNGNLIPVEFPIAACIKDVEGKACKDLLSIIKNPYYIGDQPGLTQTLGWVDAWYTKPSVYAVAAENSNHIAAAVNFAREHNLRLVVKGGGHSYKGTSNAPDSLLVWTRRMHDVILHEMFVPKGCKRTHRPQRAVSCGSGAIWMQAYDAVTTKGGAYVQGGGCTTVGVAGLVQSGGFGSFSKHYGRAAAALLEAEVVTADGEIRIANACTNPDLFWALKGGGGGSFGVVSRVMLRVRELPEFFGGATFRVRASSGGAFRRLMRQFVGFYRDQLFNDHWGESVYISPRNALSISMVSYGLSTEEGKKVWQPFLDWLKRFVEGLISGLDLYLTAEDAAEYRRPFLEPGESRRPTLTWPREFPLGGVPAKMYAIVRRYSDWLAADAVLPKLFIRADPGGILTRPEQLTFVRGFRKQTEVTFTVRIGSRKCHRAP